MSARGQVVSLWTGPFSIPLQTAVSSLCVVSVQLLLHLFNVPSFPLIVSDVHALRVTDLGYTWYFIAGFYLNSNVRFKVYASLSLSQDAYRGMTDE